MVESINFKSDQQKFLWERYKQTVDLHRSYLDLAIKLNVFNYAITGAIVSFYFSQPDEPLIKWSLLLPALMNLGLAIFFFRSALASNVSQKDIHTLANNLEFDVRSVVASVLAFLLWIFFATTLLIVIGLVVLIAKDISIFEYICKSDAS